ncbi:hypothetical protein NPIL_549501, partial [Nephila pilipes]
YGHSKTNGRGQDTCARCSQAGQDGADYVLKEQCINCNGDHPSYSRLSLTWNLEKEVTAVKTNNKVSSRGFSIVSLRTPTTGVSYASKIKKYLKLALHKLTLTYISPLPLHCHRQKLKQLMEKVPLNRRERTNTPSVERPRKIGQGKKPTQN